MSTRALGGGALDGDRLVRFVYLDESGIGDIKKERFVVTAGVIVHADVQWKKLEQYLIDLVEEVIRPEDQRDFYFHAKDLFHGGNTTPREIYSEELRKDVLRRLCFAVEKFQLPVVVGVVDRTDPLLLGMEEPDKVIYAQTVTTGMCLLQVEEYMQEFSYGGEVATMVYENNNQSRSRIKKLQKQLLDQQAMSAFKALMASMGAAPRVTKYLPIKKVVDGAYFAEKQDSSILQIADACVYVINRYLMGQSGMEPYLAPIFNQLASAEMRIQLQGIAVPGEHGAPPTRWFPSSRFPLRSTQ